MTPKKPRARKPRALRISSLARLKVLARDRSVPNEVDMVCLEHYKREPINFYIYEVEQMAAFFAEVLAWADSQRKGKGKG
jgi:hypothetical protein